MINRLQEWFENEEDLVDIKFAAGNITQSSIYSFAECILSAIEAESQGRYKILNNER